MFFMLCFLDIQFKQKKLLCHYMGNVNMFLFQIKLPLKKCRFQIKKKTFLPLKLLKYTASDLSTLSSLSALMLVSWTQRHTIISVNVFSVSNPRTQRLMLGSRWCPNKSPVQKPWMKTTNKDILMSFQSLVNGIVHIQCRSSECHLFNPAHLLLNSLFCVGPDKLNVKVYRRGYA